MLTCEYLIEQAKGLEERLHVAWVPVAPQHHQRGKRAIRLAGLITRAHQRWLRRKYRADPNDGDVAYAAVWYELYGKIPPWVTTALATKGAGDE